MVFNRTFQVWKLFIPFIILPPLYGIQSNLLGMETFYSLHNPASSLWYSIEPFRYGNNIMAPLSCLPLCIQSNLLGMETGILNLPYLKHRIVFNRTFQVWKHSCVSHNDSFILRIQSNLLGMETNLIQLSGKMVARSIQSNLLGMSVNKKGSFLLPFYFH